MTCRNTYKYRAILGQDKLLLRLISLGIISPDRTDLPGYVFPYTKRITEPATTKEVVAEVLVVAEAVVAVALEVVVVAKVVVHVAEVVVVVAEVVVVEVTVVAEVLVDSARGIGGGRGVAGDNARVPDPNQVQTSAKSAK